MSRLSKANFEAKYNNASSGNFATNSTQEIGSDDLREFSEDISDTFFGFDDDAYDGAKGVASEVVSLTELKALPTVSKGRVIVLFDDRGGVGDPRNSRLRAYILTTSALTANEPYVVIPDDYDGSTNVKVWKLLYTEQTLYPGVNSITNLKAIPTDSGLMNGAFISFRDTSSSNILRCYELVSGTDAESLPLIVRPDDYDGVTNASVWKSAVIQSSDTLEDILTNGNDGGALQIKNILDPTDPQDAATMAYVDAATGGLLTTTVTVSTAEILNINSSPKTLITAPGAGELISLQSIVIQYIFNTAAYATNVDLQLRHGNNTAYSNGGILDQTADRIIFPSSNYTASNDPSNQPITLTVSGGNPTAGSGTLKIFLTYRIITL
jgi:hypothetical protein